MTEPRTARGWQTSEITITNAAGEHTSLELGPDGLQIRARWSPACMSREHARQILEFLSDGLGFALRPGPAPSVPDLAEVALGALAASGLGAGDGEVQRPTLTALGDVDFNADPLAVGRLAIAARVARDGWHEARRWEDPLPLPVWVEQLRAGLGPAAECCCEKCLTSDDRAARAAEYQRLLTGSLRAQCQTLGHVPSDSSACSRCGEPLSRAEWSALVAAETAEEAAP